MPDDEEKPTIRNLIKALEIFASYGDIEYPTHCEHDEMSVLVSPADVVPADIGRLEKLGFLAVQEEDCFISFRYGSA